jgi:hypothetical protein
MYACLCVCMYICMYVYKYTHTHTHAHTHTHKSHTYPRVHHSHTQTHTHIYTCQDIDVLRTHMLLLNRPYMPKRTASTPLPPQPVGIQIVTKQHQETSRTLHVCVRVCNHYVKETQRRGVHIRALTRGRLFSRSRVSSSRSMTSCDTVFAQLISCALSPLGD